MGVVQSLSSSEINALLSEARKIRENALILYNSHSVGAAVLTGSGEIFGGCTIQSVISGLGVCAERAAIDHAVVHGHYRFRVLAVVHDHLVFPCGACLQYALQFYQIDEEPILIIAASDAGTIEQRDLLDLLPAGYFATNSAAAALKTYGRK